MRWLLALALVMPLLAAAADFEAGVAAARAGDYAQARREWQPLAEAGNRDAQFNMGLLYENGLGVPPDDIEGYAWLTVGQENGAEPTGLLETLKKHMSAERRERAERRAAEVRERCKLP